jgi:energy-coupling factor transport system substrate-specific component
MWHASEVRMRFSWGRFDTRTIVLIPVAIAINIVLGQTVSAVLKVPIYLDSIGTVLVGVVAGPIPGPVTGVLANLLWTYVLPPPFHNDFAAPFAVVAAFIGFFAGVVAQLGVFRPRPNADVARIGLGALIIASSSERSVSTGSSRSTRAHGSRSLTRRPRPTPSSRSSATWSAWSSSPRSSD